jgi:hypothetical protein
MPLQSLIEGSRALINSLLQHPELNQSYLGIESFPLKEGATCLAMNPIMVVLYSEYYPIATNYRTRFNLSNHSMLPP